MCARVIVAVEVTGSLLFSSCARYYRTRFGWVVSTRLGAEPGDMYTKSTASLPGGISGKWYAPGADGGKAAPIETITVVHDKNGSNGASRTTPNPRPRLPSRIPAPDPLAGAEAISMRSGDTEGGDGEGEKRSPFAHLSQTEYNFGVQQISKNGRQVCALAPSTLPLSQQALNSCTRIRTHA